MSAREVAFYSDGYRLAGVVHAPDDYQAGERRPTVMVCHGRLAIKEWVPSRWIPYLLEAGFVCFSFDYRNLGESEGTLGKIIPQEEVRDVLHALEFVVQQPEVDPGWVGVLGWGLGGGVVVSAAARDERFKAVVCASGVADGERYGRDGMIHRDWLERQREIAEDRAQRILTGKSKSFPMRIGTGSSDRDAGYLESLISVVGEERAGDREKLGIPTTLTLESMEALYAFKPIDEVHRISPRPLLIIHAIDDTHFPWDHMVDLYQAAEEPKELIGIPDSDHLRWIDANYPEQAVYVPKVIEWFGRAHGAMSPLDV